MVTQGIPVPCPVIYARLTEEDGYRYGTSITAASQPGTCCQVVPDDKEKCNSADRDSYLKFRDHNYPLTADTAFCDGGAGPSDCAVLSRGCRGLHLHKPNMASSPRPFSGGL